MSEDKLEAMKKRLSERREALSGRLSNNLGGRFSAHTLRQQPETMSGEQARMQAANIRLDQFVDTDPIGALAGFGNDTPNAPEKPTAPTGSWRCIVDSPYVSIDLTKSVSADGSLSGQGTIIYKATLKVFDVSGGGDWMALPPDKDAKEWLFKFRMLPSNHAIFSWFARPTQSPNHLYNKFVAKDGGVVETHCERKS